MTIKDGSTLTVREAAHILRRTERTIHWNISEGYLRAFKQGGRILIHKRDLREYIGSRAVR